MAKCKECYHYLVCKFWDNDDKECSQFKAASSCVEVVRAEWIEGYSGRDKSRYTLECSSCGFYFKTPCEHEYQLQDYKKDFEHCPCCCAIMDGGNEDGM